MNSCLRASSLIIVHKPILDISDLMILTYMVSSSKGHKDLVNVICVSGNTKWLNVPRELVSFLLIESLFHTLTEMKKKPWNYPKFLTLTRVSLNLLHQLETSSIPYPLLSSVSSNRVISCLHARICNFLRYRQDERPGTDTQIAAKAKTAMKRHRRNMVLLTAMALVFSITWLPLTVLNVVADLDHKLFKEKQYNLLHAVSLLIAMSSSVANPIMYGFFNSNFRRAFCDLVKVSNESKASFDIIGRGGKDTTSRKNGNGGDLKPRGKTFSGQFMGGRRTTEICSGGFKKAMSLTNVQVSRSLYGQMRGATPRFVEAVVEANSCPEFMPSTKADKEVGETDRLTCEIHKTAVNVSYDSISNE